MITKITCKNFPLKNVIMLVLFSIMKMEQVNTPLGFQLL